VVAGMKVRVIFILFLLCLVGCGVEKDGQIREVSSKEKSKTEVQKEEDDMYTFEVEAQPQESQLEVRLTLTNTSENQLIMTFPSSQQFEVIISTKERQVYKYSADKMFSQALTKVELEPGETKIWKTAWKYDVPGAKEKSYKVVAGLQPIEVNDDSVKPGAFQKVLLVGGAKQEQ
jgi:hypothetical protein